jgi:hypothetical protein
MREFELPPSRAARGEYPKHALNARENEASDP